MRLSSFRNRGVIFAPGVRLQGRIQNAVMSRLPIAKDALNLGRPGPSRANRRNDVTPVTGSRQRPLKFRQIRQSFAAIGDQKRSEEHTSELQSPYDLVCRLLLEK